MIRRAELGAGSEAGRPGSRPDPSANVRRVLRRSVRGARWGAPARAPSRRRTYDEYSVAYDRVEGEAHDRLQVGINTRYDTVVTGKPNPPSRCEYSYELKIILLLCGGRLNGQIVSSNYCSTWYVVTSAMNGHLHVVTQST